MTCCKKLLRGRRSGARAGERWTCDSCGQAWELAALEGEGCEWRPVAPEGVAFPVLPRPIPGRSGAGGGLQRTSALRPRGDTSYSDRDRAFGFMFFVSRTLPCAAAIVEGAGPCIGDRQFAHLGTRKKNGAFRKCDDLEGGCLCAEHHRQVDNGLAWRAREGFYLRMTADERLVFRTRVIAEARQAWDELTPEQQDWWTNAAAAARAGRDEPA